MGLVTTCKRRLRGSAAQRGMTIAVFEGSVSSAFWAVTEAWIVPVLVDTIGVPDYAIGLVTIVPFVVTLLVSPFSPRVIAALGGNASAAVRCAGFQAAMLLLLCVPLAQPAHLWARPVALTLAILINAVGAIASPAYFGWMGDLIPRSVRGRYWSNRMRVVIATKLACGALFAWWDSAARARGWAAPTTTLMVIVTVGALSRALSTLLLSRQPAGRVRLTTPSRRSSLAAALPTLTQALWRTDLGRWTAVWASLHAGVMIAGPFFGPYMLATPEEGGLHLREPAALAWRYSLLVYTGQIVRLLMLPAMGRLVDRYGPGAVLRTAMIAIIAVPCVWALATTLPLLVGIEIISGLGWCAAESAIGVLLLSCHRDPTVRARLIAYHQMPVAGVIACSTFVGMQLIQHHALPPLHGSEFRCLFLISMALRLPALLLAWRFLPRLETVPADWIGLWRQVPGVQPTVTMTLGVLRFVLRRPPA